MVRSTNAGLVALRDNLSARRGAEGLGERDAHLYEALASARAVYARHWSLQHTRTNQAWLEALLEDLPGLESAVGDRITEAYGGTWPEEPITVEVSPYTNRVGGYTTSDFHVTISSVDSANVMPQALEILFHEASHGDGLERPVHGMLREAFQAIGEEPPEQLWHTVLFFTAGEATQMAYEAAGRPGYRHYGDVTGLYRRGESRTREADALREHWRPFLRGEIGRTNALARLAGALASGR